MIMEESLTTVRGLPVNSWNGVKLCSVYVIYGNCAAVGTLLEPYLLEECIRNVVHRGAHRSVGPGYHCFPCNGTSS